MAANYDAEYFQSFSDASRSSAAAMVPRVVDLVKPHSVVDVGCGIGEWAASFLASGIDDVVGVDGADVAEDLRIPADKFVSADLSTGFELGRSFDLAVSMEVAEHLPPASADAFVSSLARLAPVILFSAAAPGQGGHSHLNEQWPSYWAARFAQNGFKPLDVLRPEFWSDPRVEWWYAQNALLFASEDTIQAISKRAGLSEVAPPVPPLVHPRSLERSQWRERVLATCVDIAAATPAGARIVLADDDSFGEVALPGRKVVPFTEAAGVYAGPPEDDGAALAELERQTSAGARYFAFGWPCFWQRDHYPLLEQRLATSGELIVDNERVSLFRLMR